MTKPIGLPVSLVIRTNAWDSRDAGTMAHMPRAERLEYGFLYSEFANNEVHRLDERAAWIEMNSFNGASVLDHQDQIRLQGLIYRARLRDDRIDSNAARFLKRAEAMRLKPTAEPINSLMDPQFCRSILPSDRRSDPI
ncbi:MAG: hypothetical protein ABIO29_04510 [Sphingomicrobium sp.]